MYWTTLEISAPRCALMCYPSSNITYCNACLLCIGVILLNKFNSIQFNLSSHKGHLKAVTVHKFKTVSQMPTAGPIWNKFGTRMQTRMQVNIHSWLNKLAPRDRQPLWGGGLVVTY